MQSDRCPECGEPYLAVCRCPLRDMVCKNDHEWHTCPVHGCVVKGPADHTRDSFECRCKGVT